MYGAPTPVQIVIWLAKHAFWADYGQPEVTYLDD
jgi:hypothetical protein